MPRRDLLPRRQHPDDSIVQHEEHLEHRSPATPTSESAALQRLHAAAGTPGYGESSASIEAERWIRQSASREDVRAQQRTGQLVSDEWDSSNSNESARVVYGRKSQPSFTSTPLAFRRAWSATPERQKPTQQALSGSGLAHRPASAAADANQEHTLVTKRPTPVSARPKKRTRSLVDSERQALKHEESKLADVAGMETTSLASKDKEEELMMLGIPRGVFDHSQNSSDWLGGDSQHRSSRLANAAPAKHRPLSAMARVQNPQSSFGVETIDLPKKANSQDISTRQKQKARPASATVRQRTVDAYGGNSLFGAKQKLTALSVGDTSVGKLQDDITHFDASGGVGSLSTDAALAARAIKDHDQNKRILDLHGMALDQLPARVSQVTGVVKLILSFNRLSAFPVMQNLVATLEHCDLSNNQFATFPITLCSIKRLHTLVLDDNLISSVPSKVSQMKLLRNLSLKHNALTSVAPELCRCKGLKALSLGGNQDLLFPPPDIVANGFDHLVRFLRAYDTALTKCKSTAELDISGCFGAILTEQEARLQAAVRHEGLHGPQPIDRSSANPMALLLSGGAPGPSEQWQNESELVVGAGSRMLHCLAGLAPMVTELRLASVGLQFIPPWHLFPSLQVVDVSSNRLNELSIPVLPRVKAVIAPNNNISSLSVVYDRSEGSRKSTAAVVRSGSTSPFIEFLDISCNPLGTVPLCLLLATKLQRIQLSNCQIMSLEMKTSPESTMVFPFAGTQIFPDLMHVDLSDNPLRTSALEKVLRTMSQNHLGATLQSLNLKNCILQSIPVGFFGQMPNLCEVNLAQTDITALPSDICDAQSLRVINCYACDQLCEIPLSWIDLEFLTHFNVENTRVQLPPPQYGTNLSGPQLALAKRLCQQLREAWFFESTFLQLDCLHLEEVPESWLYHISLQNQEIQAFTVHSNCLTSLPRSLSRLSLSLRGLILSHNQMEEVPVCVASLTNLEVLDCADNHIKAIPQWIGHLKQIQELYFGGNPITSLPLELASLSDLAILRTDVERISFPPRAILAQGLQSIQSFLARVSNPQVGHISLNDCGLSVIDEGLVNMLSSSVAHQLDLSRNRIATLLPEHHQVALQEELDATGQAIEPTPDMYSYLTSFQNLDISHNPLREVPDGLALVCSQNLTNLVVSHAMLHRLPGTIGSMHALSGLDVSHCRLEGIPDSISSCFGLEKILLSHNCLELLPSSLAELPCLQYVDISNNRISTIENDCFLGFKSLCHLNVSCNVMKCLPEIPNGSMPSLKKFFVSSNRINALPLGVANLLSMTEFEYDKDMQFPPPELYGLSAPKHAYNEHRFPAIESECGTAPLAFFAVLLSTFEKCQSLREKFGTSAPVSSANVPLNLSRFRIESFDFDLLNSVFASRKDSESKPATHSIITSASFISSIDFSHSNILSLSPSIASCRRLTSLGLNSLGCSEIPPVVRSLSTLTNLDVSDNIILKFPLWLADLPALQKLTASIRDDLVFPTIEAVRFKNNDILGVLNVFRNLANEPTRLHLVGMASMLTNFSVEKDHDEYVLEVVDRKSVKHVSLIDSFMPSVPLWIFNSPSITSLQISRCGLEEVPSILAQQFSLTHVDLRDNSLSRFPVPLLACPLLNSLWISGNKSIREVPIAIGSHPSLEDVKFDTAVSPVSDQTADAYVRKAVIAKEHQEQLKFTSTPGSISQGQLLEGGSDPTSVGFFDSIESGSLVTLSALKSLWNAQQSASLDLSGKGMSSIPDACLVLSSLHTLRLDKNPLCKLPEEIVGLQRLKVLLLKDTSISVLPTFLTVLKALIALDISHNPMTEIIALPQGLTYLDASNTAISSVEPIFGCPRLTVCLLAYTSIVELPSTICWQLLSKLAVLDLEGCVLTFIPASVVLSQKLSLFRASSDIMEFPQTGAVSPHEERSIRSKAAAARLSELDSVNFACNSFQSICNEENIRQSEDMLHLLRCVLPCWNRLLADGGDSNRLVYCCPSTDETEQMRMRKLTLLGESPTEAAQVVACRLSVTVDFSGPLASLGHNVLKRQLNLAGISLTDDTPIWHQDARKIQWSGAGELDIEEVDMSFCDVCSLPRGLEINSSLRVLSARHNHIKRVPLDYASLENLSHLDVSGNPLVSPPVDIMQQGPSKLLSYMRTIVASKASMVLDLTNFKLAVLPTDVIELRSLSSLCLRSNALDVLPDAFTTLNCLTNLDLGNNSFVCLPETLYGIPSLETLRVDRCALVTFKKGVHLLESLSDIDVSFNRLENFPADDLTAIPQMRLNGSISIQHNRISSALVPLEVQSSGGKATCRYLCSFNSCLLNGVLDLSQCGLKTVPSKIFSEPFSTRIVELTLDNNDLTSLPPRFTQLLNLRILSVRHCRLSELPAFLASIRSLQDLRTAGNPVSSMHVDMDLAPLSKAQGGGLKGSKTIAFKGKGLEVVETVDGSFLDMLRRIGESRHDGKLHLGKLQLGSIPHMVTDCTWIREFILDHNDIDMLPIDICSMIALKHLSLKGCLIHKLPQDIGNLTNLNYLNIQSNGLSQLPNTIGKLEKLHTLALGHNRLQNLPTTMGLLTSLTELELSNNDEMDFPPFHVVEPFVSGVYVKGHSDIGSPLKQTNLIPGFVRNRVSILSDGDYTGEQQSHSVINSPPAAVVNGLVRWMANYLERFTFQEDARSERLDTVIDLSRLSLAECFLQSPPPPWRPLASASTLRLCNNGLTSLRHTLQVHTNLVKLDLSGNLLESLPDWFHCLHHIQSLIISDNRFKSVPGVLGKCNSLENLVVSDNGMLSCDGVALIRSLSSVDLSQNKLESMPEGLKRLKDLRMLNMAFNSISTISNDVCNCTSLKELYIQNNRISSVPPAFQHLSCLEFVDLSFNPIQIIPPFVAQHLPCLQTIKADNCPLRLPPKDLMSDNDLMMSYLKSAFVLLSEGNLRMTGFKGPILDICIIGKCAHSLGQPFSMISLQLSDCTVASVWIPSSCIESITQIALVSCGLESQDMPLRIMSDAISYGASTPPPSESKVIASPSKEFMQSSVLTAISLPYLNVRVLNISRNAIVAIPSLVLQGKMPALEFLNMSRNQIQEIPDMLFRSCPSLQYLNVSENRVNKLETRSAARLGKLLLCDNSLTSLPPSICNATAISDIDVRGNLIRHIPLNIHRLKSKLQNFLIDWVNVPLFPKDLVAASLQVQMFFFEKLDLASHKGVLDLSGFKLAWIPSLPQAMHETLHKIDISNNALESIPNWVQQCCRLKVLDVSNNPILEIQRELFDSIPALTHFYVGNTSIKSIPFSIGNCIGLTEVNVAGCEGLQWPPRSVMLAGGKAIVRFARAFNSSDDEVDLSGLGISKVPLEALANDQVTSLSLNSNPLRELPSEIVRLTSLIKLSVARTDLSDLPEFLLKLPNLAELDVSDCQNMDVIPMFLSDHPTLAKILFSPTLIKRPPHQILEQGLGAWRRFVMRLSSADPIGQLDLSSLTLGQLPLELEDLHSYASLDLSHNPGLILDNFELVSPQVVSINISACSLSGLESLPVQNAEKTAVSSIQRVILNRNPLVCIPEELQSFANLLYLDLSHCKLRSVTKLPAFCPGIKRLDLSSNEIDTCEEWTAIIQEEIEEHPRWFQIEHIDLSNNFELKRVPECLSLLPCLKSLRMESCGVCSLDSRIADCPILSEVDFRGCPLSEVQLCMAPAFSRMHILFEPDMLPRSFRTATLAGRLPLLLSKLSGGKYNALDMNAPALHEDAAPSSQNLSIKATEDNSYSSVLDSMPSNQWVPSSDLGSVLDLTFTEIEDFEGLESYIPTDLSTLVLDGCPTEAIPDFIMELQNLLVLSASSCSLKALPSVLHHAQHLTSLRLKGNDIRELPEGMDTLSSLTFLDLSDNSQLQQFHPAFSLPMLQNMSLAGCGIPMLPHRFTGLRRLRILDCSRNKLTQIPNHMAEMRNLATLELKQNSLGFLPDSIGLLTNLVHLGLNANPLKYLPVTFGMLSLLKRLDIHLPSLDPAISNLLVKHGLKGIQRLLKSVHNSMRLTSTDTVSSDWELALTGAGEDTLDLRSNALTDVPFIMGGGGASSTWVRGIPVMSRLQHILEANLSDNKLVELPSSFARLTALTKLDMSHNELSSCHDDLKALKNLRTVKLNDNRLLEIPMFIVQLPVLEHLFIEQNPLQSLPSVKGGSEMHRHQHAFSQSLPLTPESAQSQVISKEQISQGWKQFTNLLTLSIDTETKLSNSKVAWAVGHDEVPLEVSSQGQSAIESYMGKIAEAVRRDIIDLSTLSLWKAPKQLTLIRSIRKVYLSSNFLRDLPSDIGSLECLRELVASDNILRSLPKSLSKCNMLERLVLNHNQIEEVPTCYGQLTNLGILELIDNPLQSPPQILLSQSFSTDIVLQYLRRMHSVPETGKMDLSNLSLNSSFTLPAPMTVGLRYMALSDNQFVSIPRWVPELPCLEALEMNRNKLASVPNYMTGATRLTSLSFSGNQFTVFPSVLFTMTKLKSLNLSNNKISLVSKEVCLFMTNLNSLDLHNNRIHQVESTRSMLSHIHNLDLSGNLPSVSNTFDKRVDEYNTGVH